MFTLCRPRHHGSTSRETSRNSRRDRDWVDNTQHHLLTYFFIVSPDFRFVYCDTVTFSHETFVFFAAFIINVSFVWPVSALLIIQTEDRIVFVWVRSCGGFPLLIRRRTKMSHESSVSVDSLRFRLNCGDVQAMRKAASSSHDCPSSLLLKPCPFVRSTELIFAAVGRNSNMLQFELYDVLVVCALALGLQ